MRRGLRQHAAAFGLAVVLGLGGAVESAACPICIGFPKKTDADLLLEGWCVILARPDQQDQFKYAPVAVLKGTYDGSDIDLLVDSATRRLLQVHLDRHVLLVQVSQHGPWQNLGSVSAEFEALVKRLLVVGMGWQGVDAATQRWEFFLPWFGHADERIRTLAYLEMGRAPYAVVRRLGRSLPREAYTPILEDRKYVEWWGLAILLLAQSESAADRQRILDSFQAAKQFGLVTNLAAWAAASIELQGADAVSFIQRCYFRDPDRKRDELVEVVKAMSLHGTEGRTELRDQIVSSYDVLLDVHPQMIGVYCQGLDRLETSRTDPADFEHRGQGGDAGFRCEEGHSSVFGFDGVRPMTIGDCGCPAVA